MPVVCRTIPAPPAVPRRLSPGPVWRLAVPRLQSLLPPWLAAPGTWPAASAYPYPGPPVEDTPDLNIPESIDHMSSGRIWNGIA